MTDLRTHATFFIVSGAKHKSGGHTTYSNSEDSEQPTYLRSLIRFLMTRLVLRNL